MPRVHPPASGDRGPALAGARVGLLEGRMGEELSNLVRRQNGIPCLAAAVRALPIDASGAVGTLLDRLDEGLIDMVVFLTGAGVDTLFAAAEKLGRARELQEGLRWVTTVCRGHKPRAALRRRELPISVVVPEPYTTTDVIDTLGGLSPAGRGVAVIHYGERNDLIADALREWGSRVLDVCVYEWALPEDTAPLQAFIDGVVEGEFDAVAFTSQVQVRHLFAVAGTMDRSLKLMNALNLRTVVAAVGPTCAEALLAVGVTPRVVPANPKMGPMIVALAEHLQAARGQLSAVRA